MLRYPFLYNHTINSVLYYFRSVINVLNHTASSACILLTAEYQYILVKSCDGFGRLEWMFDKLET